MATVSTSAARRLRRIALPGLIAGVAALTLTACSPGGTPTTSAAPGSSSPAAPAPTGSWVPNERLDRSVYPRQAGTWTYREVMGGPSYEKGDQRLGLLDKPGPYESLESLRDDTTEIIPGVYCEQTHEGSYCQVLKPSGRVLQCVDLTLQTPEILAPQCKEVTDAFPDD